MGFRIRRSIRLAPGIRFNLSKTGGSLSLGRRGATLNFSKRGTKATVGLPGSGISYSTMLKSGPPSALPRQGSSSASPVFWVIAVGLVALFVVFGALG